MDGCSICLEAIAEADAFTLACSHTFHRQCLQPWVCENLKNVCPNCRQDIGYYDFVRLQHTPSRDEWQRMVEDAEAVNRETCPVCLEPLPGTATSSLRRCWHEIHHACLRGRLCRHYEDMYPFCGLEVVYEDFVNLLLNHLGRGYLYHDLIDNHSRFEEHLTDMHFFVMSMLILHSDSN